MKERPRETRAVSRRRTAFTLLESVIALVIVAGVAGACLQARAQALAATRSIADSTVLTREMDAILAEARAGLLPQPVEVRDSTGRMVERVWSGVRAGAEFRCRWDVVQAPNPVPGGAGAGLAPTVTLARWSVTRAGQTAEVLEPMGGR